MRKSRQLWTFLVMIFLPQFFGNVTKVMKQNSLAITQLHNAIKLIYRFQRVSWIFVAKN